MPNGHDDFIKAIRRWPDARLCDFLLAAADLSEADFTNRKQIAGIERSLLPLTLNCRESPLRAVIDAIRAIAQEKPAAIKPALSRILKMPVSDLPPPRLCRLLELLVRVDFNDGEFAANRAFERILTARKSGFDANDSAVALVNLCGLSAGAGGALQMWSKLNDNGVHSFEIASAALQMVASFETAQLANAFELLYSDLSTPRTATSYKSILRDVAERAGLLAIVIAFIKLYPAKYPALYCAAFGTLQDRAGAFEIFYERSEDREPAVIVSLNDKQYSISQYLRAGHSAPKVWQDSLFTVINFRPPPCKTQSISEFIENLFPKRRPGYVHASS